MSSMVHIEVPDRLLEQAQTMIKQGWADNIQELLTESLRRYVESHHEDLAEEFIREDIAWGLHGNHCQ